MFWAAARAASTPILATTRTDSGGARGLGYEAAGGSWDTQIPELKAYNPTLFQRIRSWWTMDPELGIGGNLPMHEDMIHSAKNTLIRPLADPVIAVVQDPSVVPRAVGNAGRLAYSAVSAPRQTLTDVETAWRETHPLVLQRQLVSTVFAGAVSTSLGASRVAAASNSLDDIVIDTYGNLSRRTDLPGQAHHLNQTAAYRDVIPTQEGASIKLQGNIFTDAGAPHTRAHLSLEGFWNQYRNVDVYPTNLQYTQALRQSLRAAGLPESQVSQAVRAATRERVDYGLLGGQAIPRIPEPIRNLAR